MEPTLNLPQALVLLGMVYWTAITLIEMDLFAGVRDWLAEKCLAPAEDWEDEEVSGVWYPASSPRKFRMDLPGWKSRPLWMVGNWATCLWCGSTIVALAQSAIVHKAWWWDWSLETLFTTIAVTAFAWFLFYRDFE